MRSLAAFQTSILRAKVAFGKALGLVEGTPPPSGLHAQFEALAARISTDGAYQEVYDLAAATADGIDMANAFSRELQLVSGQLPSFMANLQAYQVFIADGTQLQKDLHPEDLLRQEADCRAAVRSCPG